MRLHHLSITAFGPFADTVEVDFDRLCEAGLFLLAGPTGAGKTSVLDAVCFALYGDVPGDRATAKRLRSDIAPDDRAPRVVLTATLGGRRFRITRSPAWQRPKKRGTGTTTQQASVSVQEEHDGTFEHVTNRLDEAGQLVSDLLGMTLSQFTQVAMLPQGRFADFLRAGSTERHRLLQHLFRASRFEDVEKWLVERRTELRRASDAHADGVDELVHRLSELADSEPPGPNLAETAESGALVGWAAGHAEQARADAADLQTRLPELARAAAEHDAARAAGRLNADRRTRHAEATVELELLDAESDAHRERVERLLLARQAEGLRAPLRAVRRGEERRLRAHEAFGRAWEALAEQDPVVEPALDDDPDSRAAAADDFAGRAAAAVREAEAIARDEVALARLRAEVTAAVSRVDTATRALDDHDTALGALPDLLEAARTRQTELAGAPAAAETARLRVLELESRLTAATERDRLDVELAEHRRLLAAAVDAHQEAREVLLEMQEQRLHGMAAELAHDLVVGGSCPVCGSCEHPSPASAAQDAPSRDDERAARRAVDDAEALRLGHEEQVRNLQVQAAAAAGRAGEQTVADLKSELHEAGTAAEHLDRDAAALPAQTARVAELEQQSRDAEEHRRERERAVTEATTIRDAAAARHDEAETAFLARLGDWRDAAEALARARAWAAAADAAADAARELVAADAAHREARADLDRALTVASLPDAASAERALLDPPAYDALEADVARYERERAAVQAVLDDDQIRLALTAPAPDVAALDAAADAARQELGAAETSHRAALQSSGRLAALATQIHDAVAAWAPIREQHRVVGDLASFVEGKSPDNRFAMRLSAYVLAWRLGQVVDAANERLATMTDERYRLERSDQRGAGERRGGLSLVIRDAWSGLARDPATLSGGETFVVSLALALGLTDVVSDEAGGARVDTLFVDEGFGSLDAGTLDDVMDALDQLRSGGRVVGVVSHVAEMRDRIPARLQVSTSRSGSTLEHVG